MSKFNKVIAFALAATMVFGSSLTVFADEVTSSTGAGTSEGHVDQKKTNVILPTSVANTTFAYTMDPEKLIEVTTHGKYGDDVVFPASNDTYVYFNNGANDQNKTVYANTSAKVKITNKSSHAINLTVNAAATASNGGKDIPLVAKDAYASATDPSLYLGLLVGSETAVAIDEDTPATQTVSIAGTPDNFKIAVKSDNSGYEYRELSLAEYKALDGNTDKTQADFDATWADTEIGLEGGVTTGKAITSDTTAPSVEVTWSWVDPSAVTIEQKAGGALWHNGEKVFYVGASSSEGFTLGDDTVTSVKVNDKEVEFNTTSASSGTWVSVTPAAIQAVGEDNGWQSGTELVFKVYFGNYEYTATYTQQ